MPYNIPALCRRACELYGTSGDGLFNSACFSKAIQEATGLVETPGGVIVDLILSSRLDVVQMPDKSYYRWSGDRDILVESQAADLKKDMKVRLRQLLHELDTE
jgi:hypothetical protein